MFGRPVGGGGAAAPLMTPYSTGEEPLSPKFTDLLEQKHTCVLYLMTHGMVTDTPEKQLRRDSPKYKATIDFYSIIGDGFEKGYSALIPGTYQTGKPVTNYALYASKLYNAFFKSRKDINDQKTLKTRDRVLKKVVDLAGSKIVALNKRCRVKYQTRPTWNRNPPEIREFSLKRNPNEIFREYTEGGRLKREAAKDTIYFPVLGLFIVWTSNPDHKVYSLVRDTTVKPLVNENTPFITDVLQEYNIFEPSIYTDENPERPFMSNPIYEDILNINDAPYNGVNDVNGARQILRRVCNGNPFTLQELSVLFQGFGYVSCNVINASCQGLQASIISPYDPTTDIIGGQQTLAQLDPLAYGGGQASLWGQALASDGGADADAYGGGPAPLWWKSFASGGVADPMNEVKVVHEEYNPSGVVPIAHRSILFGPSDTDQSQSHPSHDGPSDSSHDGLSAMRSIRGTQQEGNYMSEGGGGTRKNKQKRYRKTQKRKYTRKRHMRRKKQTRRRR
jgi:hypothetical protein